MKANIHPKWYENARVSCSCGNAFTVGATKPEIRVEICNQCHPFFTGEMKFVDTMGRVEKFQQRQKKAALKATRIKTKLKKEEEKEKRPKTLREMLMG